MFTVFAGLAAAVALSASGSVDDYGQDKILSAQGSDSKALYVCERDVASKRHFKRLHGEVKFVTAKSLLAARGSGEQWAAPRCITGAELRRLEASSGKLIQIKHQAR